MYYSAVSNGPTRLTAVIDAQANSLTSGAPAVFAVVTATYSGASYTDTLSTRLLIDDESKSAFGAGVSLAGNQRLILSTGSVIALESGGSMAFFSRVDTLHPFKTPGGTTDSLSYDPGTVTYRRTALDGSYLQFNATGRMTKSVDRFGNTTTLAYLGAPNDTVLSTITDPAGKVITFCFSAACNSSGKLQSIKILTSSTRTTTTTVDGSGRLIKIADPDGLYDSLAYNASNLLTRVYNRAHNATDYSYDAINGLSLVQSPSITLYTGSSGRPSVALSSALVTAWQPSTAGTSVGSAKSGMRPDTIFATIADGLGDSTRFVVDAFMAPTKVVDPYGAATIYVRDTASRVLRSQDAAGRVTLTSYSGFLIASTSDSTMGVSHYFTYTPSLELRTVTGSGPRTDFLYYRGLSGVPVGALKAVYVNGTANNDSIVTGGRLMEYHKVNSIGRDSAVVDSLGKGSHYTYESTWGNISKVKDSQGNTKKSFFDAAGRDILDSIPNGTTGIVSSRAYGPMNQVATSVGSLSDTTKMGYDNLLHLSRAVDPNGWVYKFAFNALGLPVARYSPADSTMADSTWYDLAGNIRMAKTRNGDVITMTYDKVGRLASRSGPGFPVDSLRYDTSKGLWVVGKNSAAYDSVVTDVRGRITSSLETLGARSYTTTYTYDAADRLLLRTMTQSVSGYQSQLRYGYSIGLGTLDTLCANGKCMAYHRKANLEPDVVTYNPGSPSGAKAWTIGQQFDTSRAIISQKFSDSTDSTAFDVTYARDSLGRVIARTPSPIVGYLKRKYAYDKDGQLLFATDSNASGMDSVPLYKYDLGGNRSANTGAVTDTITAGNRLKWELNAGTFSYDAAGNATCEGISGSPCTSAQFKWDSLGRLTTVVSSLGHTVDFAYDAFGRRVRKSVHSGTTTWFAHEGQQVVLDVDSASNAVKGEYNWLPGDNNLMAMKDSAGRTLAAVTDPNNGTLRGMVRFDSAFVIKRYYENTWGDGSDTGLVVRPRFAGAEYDGETGLYYMRARYYNPQTGRFYSEDPIGIEGGINLYRYAGNDPVNSRDPTGNDQEFADPTNDSLQLKTRDWGAAYRQWLANQLETLIQTMGSVNAAINPLADMLGGFMGRDPATGASVGPGTSALLVGTGVLSFVIGPEDKAGSILTASQQKDLAFYLGFDRIVKDPAFNSMGMKVFTDGSLQITYDITAHQPGAVWKVFNRAGTERLGTYTYNLLTRIGK